MPSIDKHRRQLLHGMAGAMAIPALGACGMGHAAGAAPPSVDAAIRDFAKLQPDTTSALVQVDAPLGGWSAGHQPGKQIFVGSAVKTFILAQFLRDAEQLRDNISESAACTIDDEYRSPGSAVLGDLSGTTAWRNVLEAMISHSDNTATDLALARVGPDRVRALIAQAGLSNTQIPDSTRRLFSYLAGAPAGTDLGWSGMQRLARGDSMGYTERDDVINAQQSMLSTAEDMVRWYGNALSGRYFTQAKSRTEFKRISSMADAMSSVVPEGLEAYGKGGSIDWRDFHCIAVPGQMLVDRVPVNFCFVLNWRAGDSTSITRLPDFVAAVSAVLSSTEQAVRSAGLTRS
ncbi:serine hydrolase [Xylophilus sp. GW821-FHT01B05]